MILKLPIASIVILLAVFLLLPLNALAADPFYYGENITATASFPPNPPGWSIASSFGGGTGCTGGYDLRFQVSRWDGTNWTVEGTGFGTCASGGWGAGPNYGYLNGPTPTDGEYAFFFVNGTDISTSKYYIAFTVSSGVPIPDPVPPDATRIIEVFPPDDPQFLSPYATSTAFDIEGTIFVNNDDFVDGMRFRQRYFNNVKAATLAAGPSFSEGGNILCNAMPSWLCPREEEFVPTGTASGSFEYEITSSGEHSYATTTNIQTIGSYTLVSEIIRPSVVFGFIPGGDTIFVGTTTNFQVVEPSSYDILVGETIQNIQDLQGSVAAECSFDFTSAGNFLPNIQECITAIMSPAYDFIVAEMKTAIAAFLSHAPWGYGMRVYTLFTQENVATSTLPSFALTIPVGPEEGRSFDFTPWAYMAGPGSPLSEAVSPEGEPILPLLLEYWNILCYMLYCAVLLFFFLGVRNHGHDDND